MPGEGLGIIWPEHNDQQLIIEKSIIITELNEYKPLEKLGRL